VIIERKQLERQLEYVRYSLFTLSMSCYILIGVLRYYKVLSNRSDLTILIAISIFSLFGSRALGKLTEYARSSHDTDTEIIPSKVLPEGTKA
jgi:hypothetical protein